MNGTRKSPPEVNQTPKDKVFVFSRMWILVFKHSFNRHATNCITTEVRYGVRDTWEGGAGESLKGGEIECTHIRD